MRLAFLGAGRVGQTFAGGLHDAGYDVAATWSRREGAARALAARAPGCTVHDDPQQAAHAADVIFLSVADDAIAPLAARVAWRENQLVVHCSGALDLDVLAAAHATGAAVASLHPLQTFSDPDIARRELQGATFTLEGDERSLDVLDGMARALGGRPLRLPPGSRALYHASGHYVGPFLLVLINEAIQLWLELGFSEEEALTALLPLARGTLEGVAQRGLLGGLAGPVARGDAGTIERHVQALHQRAPDQLELYARLARLTVPLARARGVDPSRADRIDALLHDTLDA